MERIAEEKPDLVLLPVFNNPSGLLDAPETDPSTLWHDGLAGTLEEIDGPQMAVLRDAPYQRRSPDKCLSMHLEGASACVVPREDTFRENLVEAGSDIVPTGHPPLRTTPRPEGAPMAGKKLVPSSGRAGSAIRAAQWALPLLAAGARWLSAHPEAWERIKEQAATLQKPSTSTLDGVLTTAEILREQVDYLRGSADDDEIRRAQDWAKRLDSCERAAQLLKAPGAKRKDRKTLKTSVEALRAEIFAAYIEEMSEDVQERGSA